MTRSTDRLRELVQRLIVAEVLARPGEGPLARRPLHARARPTPGEPDAEPPRGEPTPEEREP